MGFEEGFGGRLKEGLCAKGLMRHDAPFPTGLHEFFRKLLDMPMHVLKRVATKSHTPTTLVKPEATFWYLDCSSALSLVWHTTRVRQQRLEENTQVRVEHALLAAAQDSAWVGFNAFNTRRA